MPRHDNTNAMPVSWQPLEEDAPRLAWVSRSRLHRRTAYLATIRRDGSPRLHPVSPIVGNGMLFILAEPTSPKVRDLERDGRYALHAAIGPDEPWLAVTLSGTASTIAAPALRARAVAIIETVVREACVLVELRISQLLSVRIDTGEEVTQRWTLSREAKPSTWRRITLAPLGCGSQI